MIAEALAVLSGLLFSGGCPEPVQRSGWSGATLTVVATDCGREIARSRPGRVLGAAGGSGASLRLQLQCHAYFASFKREWHLEASRPAVSWPELVLTACNPPPAAATG